MKKYLAILLAFLVCCACCPPRAPRIVHQVEDDTVALTDDKGSVFCAGVWVAPEMILTAGHCAQAYMTQGDPMISLICGMGIPGSEDLCDPTNAQAYYETLEDHNQPSSKPRLGKVVAYDKDKDLALIRVSESFDHPWATLEQGEPASGEEVHVIGHPLGVMVWNYSHGFVSEHYKNLDIGDGTKVDRVAISADIHHGNSGGAAFNDRGEIVGICSFMIRGQSELGFFVGTDVIRDFYHDVITRQAQSHHLTR